MSCTTTRERIVADGLARLGAGTITVADTLRLLLVQDVKALAALAVEGYVARLLRMETRKGSQDSREVLSYSGQNVHLRGKIWRRGRDLNSRMSYPISGFQDQLEPSSSNLSSLQKDEEARNRSEP